MIDKNIDIGSYIKKYRKQANISQKQLGEIISLHQSEISRLEAGRGSVSEEIIKAMVMAGVIPEELPKPSDEIKDNINFLSYEDQDIIRNMMNRMMK